MASINDDSMITHFQQFNLIYSVLLSEKHFNNEKQEKYVLSEQNNTYFTQH